MPRSSCWSRITVRRKYTGDGLQCHLCQPEAQAKRLWTENDAGERTVLVEAYTEQEEAQFVVREIEQLVAKGSFRLADFAVMYRTNAQSRVLEEAFIRYGCLTAWWPGRDFMNGVRLRMSLLIFASSRMRRTASACSELSTCRGAVSGRPRWRIVCLGTIDGCFPIRRAAAAG